MYSIFIAFVIVGLLQIVAAWLQKTYPKSIASSPLLGWQIAIVFCGFVASALALSITNSVLANFFYHLIGGGISAGLFGLALISSLRSRLTTTETLLAVLAIVCVFGVANELLEFGLENAGYGLYSFDPHDTWRDLLANSIGGLLVALCYLIVRFFAGQRDKAAAQQ